MAIGDLRGVRVNNFETILIRNKSGRALVALTVRPIPGKRGYYVVGVEYDNKVTVAPGGRFDGGNR